MRSGLDEQLELLNKELIRIGALCEKALTLLAAALVEGDLRLIEPVHLLTDQINQKEREIEGNCLKLLLRHQPVARDLRNISAVLKIVTDMARIGNQAADIAEIIGLSNIKALGGVDDIQGMIEAVIKMVTDSIDAFVGQDIAMAQTVVDYDDVVDAYFDQIKKYLIERFSKPETDGEQAIDLLMIAKYLERIGDHTVNVAKWLIFFMTGNRE